MKTLRLPILLFVCAAVLFSCKDVFRNDKDITIHIHDNPGSYEFNALYPVSRTGDVQDFINESMEPNGLFTSSHDYFNVDTKLEDGTTFHVKSSPGKMNIMMDREKNSIASYNRIKKMCEGIKNLYKKINRS
jgi:hypothetical protein